MSQIRNHLFVFGEFRLDATEHLLYRQTGEVVPLKPKAVETLELLVMQRGRLLTKTELLERLWPDAVVEESNLSQNIYLLRKVLGLTAGGQNYIETVPKRGYRFVADVEEIAGNGGEIIKEIAIGAAKAAPIDSLAVLPMANESDDPNIEYLSDGITESIINRLSQLPQLKVMARSTVFQYKSRSVLPQKAARDLGVRAIVTGRVMQLGQRLIVRTELVDAATGWQLWGDQFDRASTDILEIQETIAHEISSKLQLKLTGEDRKRLTKRYTESTEAYHLFIKGRYYLHKRLNEVMPKAIEYFQQAIDVDPVYAPAYVGLADCYPLLSLYGALEPREAYPKAKAAARRALEIDDSLAEAHNSLGVIKLFYEWDWAGAEQAFQQAIELNAGYADAYQRYGMLLVARGRFDEATVQFDHAQALDPLSLITKTISGYAFYYARRYDAAVERFQEVIEMDRNYSMAHFRLGLTYAQQRKFDEALAELQTSSRLSGDRDVVAALGYVHGLQGNASLALEALEELKRRETAGFVSAYDKALVSLGLGDWEQALARLEEAYKERSYWLIYLQVDPALDPLRADPRFAELLEKVVGLMR
ncbi:MAG TPA: tetratricopeptide repeat protein [Pyrinomonadaceae bacterium]|nr:tetratricopeptide repeat protein [Pyrinomonadaceae bacterium]